MDQFPFPASPDPDAGRFVFGEIFSLAVSLPPLSFALNGR